MSSKIVNTMVNKGGTVNYNGCEVDHIVRNDKGTKVN